MIGARKKGPPRQWGDGEHQAAAFGSGRSSRAKPPASVWGGRNARWGQLLGTFGSLHVSRELLAALATMGVCLSVRLAARSSMRVRRVLCVEAITSELLAVI